MREIKFRGKSVHNRIQNNIKTGDWLYGSYVVLANGNHSIYVVDNWYFEYDGDVVEPNTIGQYTGLKDKFGKEIFEYDILRMYGDDTEIGIVVWEEDRARYSLENDIAIDHWALNDASWAYVVGNIHDNPPCESCGSFKELQYCKCRGCV